MGQPEPLVRVEDAAKTLDFYRTPGIMTEVGAHAAFLKNLPGDIQTLTKVIQGVLIHIFWAERYGLKLTDARKQEVEIRPAAGMISRIRAIDPSPLTVSRLLQKRLVGNCRDYATLLCTLLRQKGIPARVRCGFATYFLPHHYEDHWVCEYWCRDQQRWILVDAQLDAFQQQALGIIFNTLDVPRDQFINAGNAWLMCRRQGENPDSFGIFDMNGLWFIRGNVLRDFAALNKVEILPWDSWGIADKRDEDLTRDDYALLDHIAALSINPEQSFDEIRRLFATNDRLRMPDDWALEHNVL